MNLMQMRLYGTFTHRKNRYDINAHAISQTYVYYSQLNKRSRLQLVSWVAKTCTNMSRQVANKSHPVNNHYNSKPDTNWTNLVQLSISAFRAFFFECLAYDDWTQTTVSIYQSTLPKVPEDITCHNTVCLHPQTSNSKQTSSTKQRPK